MESAAVISPCQLYRYQLTRRWGPGLSVCFIGLNPSTADASADDPTIRRCIGFARTWGFDAIEMLNLFALRATDPRVMKAHEQPVGPDNDGWLQSAQERNDVLVACWGVHGVHQERDQAVRAFDLELMHLGLSKDGHPRHPLYLPRTARLEQLDVKKI